ncbi:MAG TPA: glycerol-3-phosphate 1-O-acyltransferase PlsY [Acidimicrobiia bacterium]|nr:glycerol-3-phosphate 1-O-acyltransferase PlsY [Acidimicrobiia bacterium]
MIWAIFAVLTAYLLGNIPFSVFVAKVAGHDLYKTGSKNPGASNVARVAGWRWGSIAMALDIAKGFVPTLTTLLIADSYLSDEKSRILAYFVGFASMLGHVVPVGRKGGKGIATGAGVVLALLPVPGIIAIACWFLTMKITKLPVISSIIAAAVLPIWVGLDHYYMWEFVVTSLLLVFVIARHTPNIRRLIRREETGVTKTSREMHKPNQDQG